MLNGVVVMMASLAFTLDASHARARIRKWVNWNQQDMEFVHPVLKQLMWTRAVRCFPFLRDFRLRAKIR